MNAKKPPVICIVLLALTLLLLLYSVWTIITCHTYISEMVAQGQLVYEGNIYNILSYYMSNCALYLLFAILFFVVSFGMYKNSIVQANILAAISSITTSNGGGSITNEEEGLSEWFSGQDE